MITDSLSALPFADMLDLLPDGVVCHEAVRNEGQTIVDFRLIYYNKAFESFAPAPYKRDLGLYMLADNPGQEAILGPAMQQYVRVVETGETATHVFFDPNLQATLSLHARKLGDGVLVTLRDVTVQQQAARQAEAHYNLLQGILTTSLNGTVVYEAIRDDRNKIVDFRFRLHNETARESIMGRIGKDIAENTLLGVYPDSHETGMFDLYVRVTETGQSIRTEHLYPDIDTWYDVSLTKLDDGCVVTFLDITERKKAQRHTDSLVQELQKSNANLEQFAYIASHDLQEPLRKVVAFSDILHNRYADSLGTDGADMIGRMQSAAIRMQTLIKDILAYSRVANTKQTFSPVDLNQVVVEVLNDLELIIRNKKAELVIGSLPTVTGDALQLHQLFQNLFSNGLKFNREGLVPQLRVSADFVHGHDLIRSTSATVLPASLANQTFHRIQVSDNGIGFEPQYAEQIFQVFQRLHTRSQYSGTGIGLSIVQKVVENHRGLINAEGRPNKGATFIILLPTQVL